MGTLLSVPLRTLRTPLRTGEEGPLYTSDLRIPQTSIAKADWWESEGSAPHPTLKHHGDSPEKTHFDCGCSHITEEASVRRFGAPAHLWSLSSVLRKKRDTTLAFKASSTAV